MGRVKRIGDGIDLMYSGEGKVIFFLGNANEMESLLENWEYKLVRTQEVGKEAERVREEHVKLIYSTRVRLVRAKVTLAQTRVGSILLFLKIEICK